MIPLAATLDATPTEPAAATEPLVVFVHIRKTAGTTIRHMIRRQYGRDQRMVRNYFSDPDRSYEMTRQLATQPPPGVRAAHGHILFWPDLPWPRGTRFFTILRDPVERTISHYSWLRARNPRFAKMPLKDALVDGEIHDNLQTRVLAASMPFVATEQTLEKALVNLDRLDAVGLTERFDESVVLFTRVLGWQPMVYSTQNVAAERPRQPELPPETLEAVVRYNALDLELYRHAGKRLTRAAAADGDDFAIDVAALRRATQCIAEAPEGADLAKLLPVSPTRPSGRLVGSAELREQLIEARAALLLRDAELERLRDPSSQSAQVEAKIHTRPERKGEALEAAAVRHRERIEKNESRIRVLVAAGEAAHSIELGELRRAVADLKQRLADIQERQAKIGLRDESSDDGA